MIVTSIHNANESACVYSENIRHFVQSPFHSCLIQSSELSRIVHVVQLILLLQLRPRLRAIGEVGEGPRTIKNGNRGNNGCRNWPFLLGRALRSVYSYVLHPAFSKQCPCKKPDEGDAIRMPHASAKNPAPLLSGRFTTKRLLSF